jgi:hypothetical protein
MQKKVILCDNCANEPEGKINKIRVFVNKDKKIKLELCQKCMENKLEILFVQDNV